MSVAEGALLKLLQALRAHGYRFVTPTPSVCRRIASRPAKAQPDLRDIFGWSLPFRPEDLPADLYALVAAGDALREAPDGLRLRYRVSTVHGRLFLHSAFPADDRDAVFLGPDSYRFADLIAREAASGGPVRSIFDIGCGAGVGGILAGCLCPGSEVWLGDVNPQALRLARINARHSGVAARAVEGSGLSAAPPAPDLVVANPPYIAGASGRTYKDGGDLHGGRLSLDWAVEAMARLAPGGRMILYTGSAIVDGGHDQLGEHLARAVDVAGCELRYAELDPDIFAAELRREAYADVERIAAVGAVITRPV